MDRWTNIKELIVEAKRILLTTHDSPDGDGLGCQSAMYIYLTELDKDCRIINCSNLPHEYQFLDGQGIFEVHNLEKDRTWIEEVDLVIVFDVGDFKRLNSIGAEIQRVGLKTLNMDHHPLISDNPFTVNVVDVNKAATGELVYDYLKSVRPGPLSKSIAEGLYTAIMTDTGSFRYSNTTPQCHLIAIECMEAGVDHTGIYQKIYESSSRVRMRLLGEVLSNIRYEHNGELAWFSINDRMFERSGATREDVDGFTDFIRSIRGVEVALMILENGSKTCRINFRSKGKYKINGIAQSLGGGGHSLAAGAVLSGTLNAVKDRVLDLTLRSLAEQNGQSQ